MGSTPMMKVQVNELEDRVVFKIDGRLAGMFVPELERSWRDAVDRRPERKVVVILRDVTCVDRSGRALLQRMHECGAAFLDAGIATQDILQQIMQERGC
jgi:hypothetical protein